MSAPTVQRTSPQKPEDVEFHPEQGHEVDDAAEPPLPPQEPQQPPLGAAGGAPPPPPGDFSADGAVGGLAEGMDVDDDVEEVSEGVYVMYYDVDSKQRVLDMVDGNKLGQESLRYTDENLERAGRIPDIEVTIFSRDFPDRGDFVFKCLVYIADPRRFEREEPDWDSVDRNFQSLYFGSRNAYTQSKNRLVYVRQSHHYRILGLAKGSHHFQGHRYNYPLKKELLPKGLTSWFDPDDEETFSEMSRELSLRQPVHVFHVTAPMFVTSGRAVVKEYDGVRAREYGNSGDNEPDEWETEGGGQGKAFFASRKEAIAVAEARAAAGDDDVEDDIAEDPLGGDGEPDSLESGQGPNSLEDGKGNDEVKPKES